MGFELYKAGRLIPVKYGPKNKTGHIVAGLFNKHFFNAAKFSLFPETDCCGRDTFCRFGDISKKLVNFHLSIFFHVDCLAFWRIIS
ncbi:hypothetical protein GCM10027299_41750 [Larkinella ripae]